MKDDVNGEVDGLRNGLENDIAVENMFDEGVKILLLVVLLVSLALLLLLLLLSLLLAGNTVLLSESDNTVFLFMSKGLLDTKAAEEVTGKEVEDSEGKDKAEGKEKDVGRRNGDENDIEEAKDEDGKGCCEGCGGLFS